MQKYERADWIDQPYRIYGVEFQNRLVKGVGKHTLDPFNIGNHAIILFSDKKLKEPLIHSRLTAGHATRLHLFRHTAQKISARLTDSEDDNAVAKFSTTDVKGVYQRILFQKHFKKIPRTHV